MNKIAFQFIVLCMFSLGLISCGGDGGEDGDVANSPVFDTYLSQEMSSQNVSALSVLIFKEDKVLYEKAMGKSSIEKNTVLQKDDMFLIASISKVVTATALLQLYDKGEFDLDDEINDYLSFEVNSPDFPNTGITFEMLLTHTSGIADSDSDDLDNEYHYGKDSPKALSTLMKEYLLPNGALYDKEANFHNFEPGTDVEYSNMGNALIGLLVEEISGKGFNEYCKTNIFTPLKMTKTAWRLDEINTTIVQPYEDDEKIEHYTFTDYPNGGLRSTTNDMFKFLSALVQGGTVGSFQLLKSATVKEMITPQIPSLDKEVGLHLFIMDSKNNLWGHDGGEQGVSTIMGFNPTTKIGAIIFSNQSDVELETALTKSYQHGVEIQ